MKGIGEFFVLFLFFGKFEIVLRLNIKKIYKFILVVVLRKYISYLNLKI